MRAFCRSVIESKEYQESVWRRIKNDTLPPQIETLICYYAAGKPPDQVILEDRRESDRPLEEMTESELAAEASAVSKAFLNITQNESTGSVN